MRAAQLADPGEYIDAGGPGFRDGQLFEGVCEEQFACVRSCLGVQPFSFERGEEILRCAGRAGYYGVLVSGIALDVRNHANGERSLVDVIEPGDLLGEGWRAGEWHGGERPRERAVVGASSGMVFLLDPARLTAPEVSCPAKSVVQANLIRALLVKEERMRARLEILGQRSLRGRIGRYLSFEAQRRGSASFTVPLLRAELAEYLHVDRTALSRELARMRADGLIEFHRREFSLLQPLEELAA